MVDYSVRNTGEVEVETHLYNTDPAALLLEAMALPTLIPDGYAVAYSILPYAGMGMDGTLYTATITYYTD